MVEATGGTDESEITDESNRSKDRHIAYYRMRLDHAQAHTVSYSRLIYMISGGVLTLMLGAAEFVDVALYRVWAFRFGLFLIAIVNGGHGFFIINQRDWYRRLDEEYRNCISVEIAKSPAKWHGGSLAIYSKIHFIVAILSLVCLVGFWNTG